MREINRLAFLLLALTLPLAGRAVGEQSEYKKVEASELLQSPQKSWARPIIFKDALTAFPTGRDVSFDDDRRYTPFTTKVIGTCYAAKDLGTKMKKIPLNTDCLFSGTVFQHRGRFYVIAQDFAETINTNQATLELQKAGEQSANDQGLQCLADIISSAQAIVFAYAKERDLDPTTLYDPKSEHYAKVMEAIRNSIHDQEDKCKTTSTELFAQYCYSMLARQETTVNAGPQANPLTAGTIVIPNTAALEPVKPAAAKGSPTNITPIAVTSNQPPRMHWWQRRHSQQEKPKATETAKLEVAKPTLPPLKVVPVIVVSNRPTPTGVTNQPAAVFPPAAPQIVPSTITSAGAMAEELRIASNPPPKQAETPAAAPKPVTQDTTNGVPTIAPRTEVPKTPPMAISTQAAPSASSGMPPARHVVLTTTQTQQAVAVKIVTTNAPAKTMPPPVPNIHTSTPSAVVGHPAGHVVTTSTPAATQAVVAVATKVTTNAVDTKPAPTSPTNAVSTNAAAPQVSWMERWRQERATRSAEAEERKHQAEVKKLAEQEARAKEQAKKAHAQPTPQTSAPLPAAVLEAPSSGSPEEPVPLER